MGLHLSLCRFGATPTFSLCGAIEGVAEVDVADHRVAVAIKKEKDIVIAF